ncbi:MAG: crossover junction endodeoxyribonuclease RuvC [Deltaproteobacteria bacterium]|nr:MAG: crossover junction endodeoxyribonuclease RuvC [Deltaproteobacteria bacterium]
MRIIGIDPGSKVTGYGIVEQMKHQLRHVASGRVVSPSGIPFHDRLKNIYTELGKVIACHAPEAMAVEDLFIARNVQSALKLGHARGVAMLAGLNAELVIAEYSPMEVKKALVGYGRAQKEQVQEMVRILLSLAEPPESNTADALAVAICHLHWCQGVGKVSPRSSL